MAARRHIISRDPLDARAVAAAIAIPALVVQAKGHGHAGTAMGMAGVAHALFGTVLRHDPSDPAWAGRDRFVLSAGHASLLLYIQLYLTGYGLTLDDLAHTRMAGSPTPGHPERGHTAGVDMSTGPLGQGLASAVGLALATRRDEALFGAGTGLFDPTIWVLAGDGCMQEGVASEAASLAGTQELDNLVVIWDDNRITIDGPTSEAFGEDVRARFLAYGWHVLDVPDALDLDAVTAALRQARHRTGRPTLVAVRSVIGWPSPVHAGRSSAHAGAYGADDVADVLELLGFARDAGLADLVPDDVLAHCRAVGQRGATAHREWDEAVDAWRAANPELATARDRLLAPPDLAALDAIDTDRPQATRATTGAVLRALRPSHALWGGSADLSESTNVALPGASVVSAACPGGEQLRFGIREHAMAAILSGVALHGLWRPYGSTYLAFSDYARGAIRLAALMGLPVLYLFTHDSVAVGEDGPTHQPVEQLAGLRSVPRLDVVRPGDARETVAAWRRVLAHPDRPTAFIGSRQALPVLPQARDEDVWRGGYVLWSSDDAGDDPLLLLATGSEVSLALDAAHVLAGQGCAVRVVSMPCLSWFDEQPREYRDAVLPPSARRRVAIEAGRTAGWYRYVGLDGAVIGVDDFGRSAPGDQVLAGFGLTLDHVLDVARAISPLAHPGPGSPGLSGRS